MTSQVEVPSLTGLIHFISGKRRVNIFSLYVLFYTCPVFENNDDFMFKCQSLQVICINIVPYLLKYWHRQACANSVDPYNVSSDLGLHYLPLIQQLSATSTSSTMDNN